MGTLLLQEHARWLTLANLSDREKNMLDSPIVPDGLFCVGPCVNAAALQSEAKPKEDEAFWLCLPRKALAISPAAQQKEFMPGNAPNRPPPPHFMG